ncbi:MAG: hypothetical protein KC731_16980 [Myxococcales bacterium]|nr:hypothetical protein [Myxococcales bacterium]
MTDQPGYPDQLDSDSDDVRWALETGRSMWSQGDHQEALKWLKRAAETASEEEDDMRSLTLAKAAAELRAVVDTEPAVAPPEAPPAPSPEPASESPISLAPASEEEVAPPSKPPTALSKPAAEARRALPKPAGRGALPRPRATTPSPAKPAAKAPPKTSGPPQRPLPAPPRSQPPPARATSAGPSSVPTPRPSVPLRRRPEPGSQEIPPDAALESEAPESEIPESEIPASVGPESQAPESEGPESEAPESAGPASQAPLSEPPVSKVPLSIDVLSAPAPESDPLDQRLTLHDRAEEPTPSAARLASARRDAILVAIEPDPASLDSWVARPLAAGEEPSAGERLALLVALDDEPLSSS